MDGMKTTLLELSLDNGVLHRVGDRIFFAEKEYRKPYWEIEGNSLFYVSEDRRLVGIIQQDSWKNIVACRVNTDVYSSAEEKAVSVDDKIGNAENRYRDYMKNRETETTSEERTDDDPIVEYKAEYNGIKDSGESIHSYPKNTELVTNIFFFLLFGFASAFYAVYKVWGESRFEMVCNEVSVCIRLVLPIFFALVCFYRLTSEIPVVSHGAAAAASIITYVCSLTFCFMLTGSGYKDFIYDMIPFDGIGCDAFYYLIISFMVMLPMTFLPLLLRLVINKSSCFLCCLKRYYATNIAQIISIALTTLITIGREIITEVNIINALFAALLLSSLQVIPVILVMSLWEKCVGWEKC